MATYGTQSTKTQYMKKGIYPQGESIFDFSLQGGDKALKLEQEFSS